MARTTQTIRTPHISKFVQPVSKKLGIASEIKLGLRPCIPVASDDRFSPNKRRPPGAASIATRR